MNAGTVVLRSQLPQARVLARSFARHNPGHALRVLLVDDRDDGLGAEHEPFSLLRPADIGVESSELHRMAMLFGRHLTVALKPWLVEFLLRSGEGAVIFLDHQVMIYDSLATLGEEAKAGSVVLVPHVLDPLPRDGLDPDETAILGQGMFSAGTYALGPSNHDFVEFLKVRLRRECVVDIPKMRMLDQRWLDFVPSLFPYRVERDPGINVAYWNLHERPLTRKGHRTLAGGSPLRSFNFSGLDPRVPGSLGTSELSTAPRVTAAADPIVLGLCEEYRAQVLASGFDGANPDAFGFDTLPDGAPIEDGLRTLYADALEVAEESIRALPPDPFDPSGISEFRNWAREAHARQGLVTPDSLLDPSRESSSPPPDARAIRSRIRRYVRRRAPWG